MKSLAPMLLVTLVGCGLFTKDEVDEEAAQVYVGEWELAALQSQDQDIADPVDAGGELAIDDELDADYHIVFADDVWAYEIQAKGPVEAADAARIEHELEGVVGRVPLAGGDVEVLEFLGQLQCTFTPGGLVCNVFGVAQNDIAEELRVDLDAELLAR